MMEMARADSTSFPQPFQRVASAQFRRPLLHLVSTQEARHRYLTECVPLHKAALRGDWKEASKILVQDNTLLRSAISKGWATVLHIAAGANHVHFVEELVRLMQRDDLELQDEKGNTAFCFAAAVGNVEIAEIMLRKNESLPTIRGGEGVTPLLLALLQGRSEMARYLLPKSKDILEESDWKILFNICLNSELYDLALEMLNEKKMLAFARIGGTSETSTGETSTGETSNGEPGTGEPGTLGSPGTGEPGNGETGTGETGISETGTGETGTGETGTGAMGTGATGTGETGTSEPGNVEVGTGEIGTGETGTGETGIGETGLHVLARKPSASCCQGLSYGKHLLHFCTKDASILKLINCMWNIFLTELDDSTLMDAIRRPSQVTFIAAEVGNFEFLSVVISTYPDLIWELDTMGRSIIHTAVLYRHASIFNLIHEIGPMKDLILTFTDDDDNNLLHCAARLAPANRLNIVSGAALQMMLELSWFEEVKKIMIPQYIEMKNSEGLTARQIFTREHEELLKNGESWMTRTANSCMVVSTLIATGVFAAAFSVPGGNNDNTGSPNYMEKPAFLVFALSDAIALISSSTSILIFLSILISRYAEDDFLMSLPLKLISGLVALFISIISMMIAFSSAFFITYYHGMMWVPNFISALAFVPIPLFIFLQFPLWSDIVYSTYICSSLFRPSKRMIH